MNTIHFLQQPKDDTCMSACVAMVLGHPAPDMVIAEFHQDFSVGLQKPSEYLVGRGLKAVPCLAEKANLQMGMVYIVTAPSLNLEGELHAVVIDTRNDDVIVYDPNKGRWGRCFYTKDPKTLDDYPIAKELKGYVFLVEIDYNET